MLLISRKLLKHFHMNVHYIFCQLSYLFYTPGSGPDILYLYTYSGLAASVSSVSGPGVLVQAVGYSKECDVVVP